MTDKNKAALQRLSQALNKPQVRQWAVGLASLWLVLALFAYFIAPPLAKAYLSERLGQVLGREVTIESMAINPLTLSARVDGFSAKDSSGAEQFGFAQLDVNFSSLSIAQAGVVVDALHLKGPRVSLVRLADGRYNLSDLLDKWLGQPADKPSALPRFSLNNIQVQDGAIDFDDRPKGTRHTVRSLAFDLPFISSMAYKADVFVHPRFSALVDDAKLALEGQSKPFAASHASTLSLQLQALDLAQWQPYLPPSLPVRLKAGQLSTELHLGFSRRPDGVYSADLSGKAHLAGLAVTELSGKPFLTVDKATLELQPSDPLMGQLTIGQLALERLSAGQAQAALFPLHMDKLLLQQALLDLPARRLSVASVQAKAAQAHIVRTAQGHIDWLTLPTPLPAAATAVRSESARVASPPWATAIGQLTLEDASLQLEDRTQSPAAVQTLEHAQLQIDKLDFAPGQKSGLTLAATLNRSGTVKAKGELQWQPLAARLQLDSQTLPVAPLQGYVAPYLNVALVQGQISNSGELTLQFAQEAVKARYTGALTLGNFLAVDKVNSADFLKWKSLYLGGVDAQLEPLRLNIGEVAMSDFYSRLILNKEGQLNLADILRSPAPSSSPTDTAREQGSKTPPSIQIGKVTLQNGQVNFSDQFVRPNYSANVTRLGGSIQNLSSAAGTVADLDLRGSYGQNAPVHISAKLNPLADKKYLDLQAEVSSIDLVDFSPYSGKYAGYTIDKGKLSLNASYKLQDRQLNADNRLFIDQLTFGDKVESPDATQLPVQLAIALLKNNRGEIDINLPISGSLDDPHFSIGGLIFKVIANLFVKAVSAPFALLGSLFGGGEELSSIAFAPGRADLDPAALQKLQVLAKAMREREGLKLEITASADPKSDEEGLKRVAMARAMQLEKRKDMASQTSQGTSSTDVAISITSAEYNTYLARAYRQARFPKPRNLIGLPKDLPPQEMEKLMLANQTVTDEDMRALATARAQATQSWLVEQGQVPLGRLFLLPVKVTEGTGNAGDARNRVDFSLR